MPVDWDALESELDRIIDKSAARTDDQLAGRISSVTRFTDEEIKDWFPDPADLKKLARLMNIVQSADDRNRKVNRIVSNAEDFAGVVLTLLGKMT